MILYQESSERIYVLSVIFHHMSEGTVRTRPPGTCDSITIDIIETVAAATDEDPMTLPPLYEHVNTEALESLFKQTPSGRDRTGKISFQYYGFVVTVSYDGGTTIDLSDDS